MLFVHKQKPEQRWKYVMFSVIVLKCCEIWFPEVLEGLGPDMGSRTYEKGQELLLFLHAGGKAPVWGKISENMEFHRNSGKSQNSIKNQKIPINHCFPVKSAPSRNLVFP